MNKSEIRKIAIEKRKQTDDSLRAELSKLVSYNFFKLAEVKNANNVFCYISTKFEISTEEIIKKLQVKNANVYFPKITGENSMVAQKIDGLEIIDKKNIDICVMPGLAFTVTGQRLGYGKGFYDRFLENLNCVKIGLSFDFQIVDSLPVSDFDINADYLVTDRRIINCKIKSVL